MTRRRFLILCLLPLGVFTLAFLAIPLGRLILASGEGDAG